MPSHPIPRRAFLAGTAGGAIAASTFSTPARAERDSFVYEVQRTEDEWRAMLTKGEYKILRENDTELPKTSDLWQEERAGTYACRGCDLTIYDSVWKEPLDIGWVFFAQSEPDTVLMGIDGSPPYGNQMGEGDNRPPAIIEAHCRRCGSHLGHILTVRGKTLHCINGQALTFAPSEA